MPCMVWQLAKQRCLLVAAWIWWCACICYNNLHMKWVLWCWAASGELGMLPDMIVVGKTIFACKLAKQCIPVGTKQDKQLKQTLVHFHTPCFIRIYKAQDCRMQHGVCNTPWIFLPHVGRLLSRKANIAFASPMHASANLPVQTEYLLKYLAEVHVSSNTPWSNLDRFDWGGDWKPWRHPIGIKYEQRLNLSGS